MLVSESSSLNLPSTDNDFLKREVKTVIDPTIILLPTRADDVLLDSLDPNGTARNVEGSSGYFSDHD